MKKAIKWIIIVVSVIAAAILGLYCYVSDYRNAAATEVSSWCTFGDALKEHIWSFLI